MNLFDRFACLLPLVMHEMDLDPSQQVVAADCLLSMPERCIPRSACLRYFVYDVLSHFLNGNSNCRLQFRKASLYIDNWKSKFT